MWWVYVFDTAGLAGFGIGGTTMPCYCKPTARIIHFLRLPARGGDAIISVDPGGA